MELQPDGHLRLQDRATAGRVALVTPDAALDLRGLKLKLGPAALDFDVYSLDDAVERLQKAVTIKRRSPEANILDVSYQGTDPQLVQAVPNVLAARFIVGRQSDRHAQARSTAKFLREQIEKLSAKLRDAENSLRTFRERAGVVSLPDEASTERDPSRGARGEAERDRG